MRNPACWLLMGLVALTAHAQPIAFTDVRIVDGNGGAPVEHGVIVVEGDKIVSVGPSVSIQIPSHAHRIDARGRTALPGLADMHAHLAGGWDGVSTDLLGYRRYLNALLYAGVTTVLDTGNVEPYVLQLRAETAAGRLQGPHIYCVGPLIDSPDAFWTAVTRSIVSKDQVPGLVRSLASEHVDLIKLYAGLPDLLVAAISKEAEAYHLRTIIDAHARNGSADLMREGIAGYAHLPTRPLSEDAIATAREHHVFFISTLAVQESFARRRFENPSFLDQPLIADTTPAFALKALREETRTSGRAAAQAAALARLHNAQNNLRRLTEAGLLVAAGTDAPYPGDFQGEGLHRELELMVESGLSPLQAITAATRNAAQIVNAQAQWGTLEPGKLADLLVVEGDPDRDIGATRHIAFVMQHGKILDRAKLRLNPATDPGYQPIGGLDASGP